MAAMFVENMRFEEPKADLPLIDKKSVTNIIRLVLQGKGFLQNKLSRFIAGNSQAGKGAWPFICQKESMTQNYAGSRF